MTALKQETFKFKAFSINQEQCSMKVGTDGVLLGAWAMAQAPSNILDIGCGTGVISIILAQRYPEAQITGVEIDEAACAQAAENMASTPWTERISAELCAIQEFSEANTTEYDLIVSNPPFFSGGTFSMEENRMNVRHTVKLSHGDLIHATNRLLAPNGTFAVVLPYMEGLRFIELAERARLYPTQITNVRPRPQKSVNRLLITFSKHKQEVVENEISIREEVGSETFTEAYRNLTKDYYLKF